METVVVAAVVIVALLVIGSVVMRVQEVSQKGWLAALESERQVRVLLTARITTLENRVDARNWQEFATLQTVGDETAKVGWAQTTQAKADPEFQALAAQWRDQGADLESEDEFEGGSIIG